MFSSIFLCFGYSYVWQTKLASSVVNFWAHNNIVLDLIWSAKLQKILVDNFATPCRYSWNWLKTTRENWGQVLEWLHLASCMDKICPDWRPRQNTESERKRFAVHFPKSSKLWWVLNPNHNLPISFPSKPFVLSIFSYATYWHVPAFPRPRIPFRISWIVVSTMFGRNESLCVIVILVDQLRLNGCLHPTLTQETLSYYTQRIIMCIL